MIRRRVLRHGAVAILMLAASPAAAAPVVSHVTTIRITGTQALGRFGEIPYMRTYGVIEGVIGPRDAIVGLARLPRDAQGAYHYTTQFETIAPAPGAAAANQVVFVEAENRGSPLSFNKINGTAIAGAPDKAEYTPDLGNGFLERHATSYARVQWQAGIAAGVPAMAQGVGLAIMRDFGRMLLGRSPRPAISGGPALARYRQAILGGISQSSWFVNTFIAEGFNAGPRTGRPVFNAAFAIDGTGNWLALNLLAAQHHVAQHPYLDPAARPLTMRELLHRPASDPLYVDVANYTDFYRLHASLTDTAASTARFRRYDWPAAHHAVMAVPPDPAIFGKEGCNDGKPVPLNPIDYPPYLRALLWEMERAAGVATAAIAPDLPPSTVFTLGPAPAPNPHFNPLPGVALRVPEVDANAMPVGGVRFPDVDLPVGRPKPVSLPPVITTSIDAVCGNIGMFQPFSHAEMVTRYHSEPHYLTLYDASLKRLMMQGFVLPEDEVRMLRIAGALYREP